MRAIVAYVASLSSKRAGQAWPWLVGGEGTPEAQAKGSRLHAISWVDQGEVLCLLCAPRKTKVPKMKRTYQPHNTRRVRTHGFRARMATSGGRKVINNRRRKGRARLAPTIWKK